jgi:hypothetical protein
MAMVYSIWVDHWDALEDEVFEKLLAGCVLFV